MKYLKSVSHLERNLSDAESAALRSYRESLGRFGQVVASGDFTETTAEGKAGQKHDTSCSLGNFLDWEVLAKHQLAAPIDGRFQPNLPRPMQTAVPPVRSSHKNRQKRARKSIKVTDGKAPLSTSPKQERPLESSIQFNPSPLRVEGYVPGGVYEVKRW